MKRLRRWLRAIALLALGLVAFLLALLVFLDSSAGHALIRDVSTGVLNDSVLAGRVSLGSIEGTLFEDLTLRELRITDAGGRDAIRVRRLRLAFELAALRDEKIHVRAIEIEGPEIFVIAGDDGQLNLAALVKPSAEADPSEPEPEGGAPSSLFVNLDKLVISDGKVHVPKNNIANFPFALSVTATVAGDDARASLQLSAGSARLELRDLEASISRQLVRGVFDARVPAELWRELALDPALAAALSLQLQLSHGSEARPWKIDGKGELSGAPIELAAEVGPQSARAALSLLKFDPLRAHGAAPPGLIDLTLAADFASWTAGRAKVELGGQLDLGGQRVSIARLATEAAIREQNVDVQGALEVRPPIDGPGLATASWTAAIALAPAPRLARSSVELRARGLRSLAPALIPADGAIELSARASGPFDALAAQATVRGSTIALDAISLAGFEVDADFTGLPARASGSAAVSFRKLVTPAIKLDAGRVDAKIAGAAQVIDAALEASGPDFVRRVHLVATATRSRDRTAVRLAELSVDTPPASWSAREARLAIGASGAVIVERFELESSAGGKISAAGHLDIPKFPDAPANISLQISDFQLAALGAEATGEIDLAARLIAEGGVASASVAVDAAGLRRGPAGPVDFGARVAIDRRRIEGRVDASGPQLGRVSIRGSGRSPRNPLDGNAWMREGELSAASGTLDELSLEAAGAMTSTSARFGGTVAGRFDVGARGERAKVAIEAKQVIAPGLRLPADVSIDVDADPAHIRAEILGKVRGSPLMQVHLDSGAGTTAWIRRGARALEGTGSTLVLSALNVPAKLIAELAGLDEKDPRFDHPRGAVSLQVSAIDRGRVPQSLQIGMRAETRKLAMAKTAPELDLTTTATLADGTGQLGLSASLDGGGKFAIEAEAAIPDILAAEEFKKLGPKAVRKIFARVEDFRLDTLAKLGLPGTAKIPSGRAGVEVDLGPAFGRGHAALSLRELILDRRLRPVAVSARVDLGARMQTLSATIAAGDQKFLGIAGTIDAPALALAEGRVKDPPLEVKLEARDFPLQAAIVDKKLAAMSPVKLSLAAAVSGRASKPSAQIALDLVSRGRLALEAKLTELAATPQIAATLRSSDFDLAFAGPVARTFANAAVGLGGRLEGALEIAGPAALPAIEGTLSIEDIRAVLPGAPLIDSTRLALEFSKSAINLDVAGKMGGGDFGVELAAKLEDGFRRLGFEGGIHAQSVRVSAGTQVAAIDADVRITGRRDGRDTSAEVVLERTIVNLPSQKSRRLAVIETFEDIEYVDVLGAVLPEPAEEELVEQSAPGDAKTNITVKTGEVIVVRGGTNELRIIVDLALAGEGQPKLIGEVEVERGRLNLIGKDYAVRKGVIVFDGRNPPDPRLDIQLAHDFEAVTLLLLVSGTGRKPNVRFASEPGGYSQAELLSFFVGAGPSDDGAGAGKVDTGKVGGGLIASQLAGATESLPLPTVVDVDLGESGKRSGSVSGGVWLTDDVFLAFTYRFNPIDEQNRTEGTLRWHFARGWTLETRFGDRQTGGVEAVWLKRF